MAEHLASLAVRGSERRVDFHAIVAHEMSDVSILSRFIRQREKEKEIDLHFAMIPRQKSSSLAQSWSVPQVMM